MSKLAPVVRAAVIATVGITCLSGCRSKADRSGQSPDWRSSIVTVEESYLTERDTLDNVDSPAMWHGEIKTDGGASADAHWLLTTAKETDAILVFDLDTSRRIRRIGASGTGPGELERPNGIVVIDTLMFVVERDNARVQAFGLPSGTVLGEFGAAELRRPYGLAVVRESGAADGDAPVYRVFVTDNYELPDETVPPNQELDERVKEYTLSVSGAGLRATFHRAFGDTSGSGVLRVVESIAADPAFDRLLIAEEEEGRSHVKVYGFDGHYTGVSIDSLYFPNQAEGIALYECGDSGGVWIATDQADARSSFHAFERETLAYVGSFRGQMTANTDGIALSLEPSPEFPKGTFAAVHDDGNVSVFDWRRVAAALNLGCPTDSRDQ